MRVKLSELILKLESGGRPKGGAIKDSEAIPSIGAEHLNESGGFNLNSLKYIPIEYYNKLKSGRIEKSNILVVKDGATTGKTIYVHDKYPFSDSAVNEHVFVIKIDSKKAFPFYIYQYLRSPQGKREILSDFRGATVGGISRKFIDKVNIQLLPLKDQIRIANILSRAETLIAKRKESIQLLDELLKSTFLDMFGDPVRNEKGWEKKAAISYADCIVPGRDKPKSFTGGIPWVTTDDLEHLSTTIKSKKDIGLLRDEIKQVKARLIPKDSVLMTCVGDLGVISLAGQDMVVNQQLHSFQCKKSINNKFLMFTLSYQKKYMYRKASKTTVPYMNKTICNSIPVIKPPLELQNKFAQIVEKVENIKTKYQESIQELENLYASLSQKAFKGELDLSKMEVEEYNLGHAEPGRSMAAEEGVGYGKKESSKK